MSAIGVATFSNTAPRDRSYRDHLKINFLAFLDALGAEAITCHPSIEFAVSFVGRAYTTRDRIPEGQGYVGDKPFKIINL